MSWGKPPKFKAKKQAAIVKDRLKGMSLRKLAIKYKTKGAGPIITVLKKHFDGTTGPMAIAYGKRVSTRYADKIKKSSGIKPQEKQGASPKTKGEHHGISYT